MAAGEVVTSSPAGASAARSNPNTHLLSHVTPAPAWEPTWSARGGVGPGSQLDRGSSGLAAADGGPGGVKGQTQGAGA